jgi:regulatory factor X
MNVLRSVALSTNSVAASVEPVMQQQFFTLSPMPGQESFSAASLEVPSSMSSMGGMSGMAGMSSMMASSSAAAAASESMQRHAQSLSQHGMIHTPTTSSMLAALQNDPFPVDSFGDFGLPSFMEGSMGNMSGMSNMSNMSHMSNGGDGGHGHGGHGGHDDSASGMTFPDFGSAGTPFDVSSSFAPSELSLPASTPAGSASPDEQLR